MGNFSRDTFSSIKHYVSVRLQQGVPIVDADWNEMDDIHRYELRAFLKWFVGDGVPQGNDGFHIVAVPGPGPGPGPTPVPVPGPAPGPAPGPVPGSLTTGPALPLAPSSGNDFVIKAGRCLVDGWDMINEQDIRYSKQPLYENDALASCWDVDPLPSLDSLAGDLVVYLDAWEREVDSSEDPELKNENIDIETCVRVKREWVVRVAEATDGTKPPDPPSDHVYYALALLIRPSGQPGISPNNIVDLRTTCALVYQKAPGTGLDLQHTLTATEDNDALTALRVKPTFVDGDYDDVRHNGLIVEDGSVLFDGTLGSTPVSGAGTRLMWVPAKAAFRAGRAYSDQWDDAKIGSYSTAMGSGTVASGLVSTAMGENARASGSHSTALGAGTEASGHYSTALGASTEASGSHSTAMGYNTAASGDYSTAMGRETAASGDYSTAMGRETAASGLGSIAMGDNTTASGSYSTAMGSGTAASGDISTAMGYNTTASGHQSTAIGLQTEASGSESTAIGAGTAASGIRSTALGSGTTASGSESTAMGTGTTASGSYSTAMGSGTAASGDRSTAMGFYTVASGDCSTTMGRETTASGDASTAMGVSTVAQAYASLVIGRLNNIGGNQTSWVSDDPVFVIGNGYPISVGADSISVGADRRDAFVVYKDGSYYHAGGACNPNPDYAEYFESADGKAISPGTAVALENGKVRPAKNGEIPIGVISANPGIVGGVHIQWPKKFLRDEFGNLIMEDYQEETMVPKTETVTRERQKVGKKTIAEDVTRPEIVLENGKYVQKEVTETITREVNVPVFEEVDLYDASGENVIGKHRVPVMETYEEEIEVLDENGRPVLVGSGEFVTERHPKLNPEYDASQEYIPREQRPEWNCVGLLGQLCLRKGQPVADTWIKMSDISDEVELWLVK